MNKDNNVLVFAIGIIVVLATSWLVAGMPGLSDDSINVENTTTEDSIDVSEYYRISLLVGNKPFTVVGEIEFVDDRMIITTIDESKIIYNSAYVAQSLEESDVKKLKLAQQYKEIEKEEELKRVQQKAETETPDENPKTDNK
jgi:hypothetical protein